VQVRLIFKLSRYQITKRQKLTLMSFFLTVILIGTQTVSESLRYQVMGFLGVATALLAIFSLWGELSGIKYFLLLLLPVYFVMGASLFYFLIPVRWLTRLPFALAFGISVYLLMLTSNIYNIAAIRTIALLRAAHAVGLLFTLVSAFFLTNVLFSLHLAVWWIVPAVLAICGPLYMVSLWSYELEEYISGKVFLFAIVYTLVTVQIATLVSFWPIVPINGALVIVTIMYVLLGLGQFVLSDKLKTRIVLEHITVAMIVIIIVMLSTRWSG